MILSGQLVWHRASASPDRTLTSSFLHAGDFDAGEMRQLVEGCMGRWQVAAGQPAVPPSVPNPPLPPQQSAGQARHSTECERLWERGDCNCCYSLNCAS